MCQRTRRDGLGRFAVGVGQGVPVYNKARLGAQRCEWRIAVVGAIAADPRSAQRHVVGRRPSTTAARRFGLRAGVGHHSVMGALGLHATMGARGRRFATLSGEEAEFMNERRAMGALETEVLECLWAVGEPLTPREVLEETDEDLAYTTIMTILTRLWQKGLVDRERSGKAFRYSPTVTEAELLASRMRSVLQTSADQKATLSRFVQTLSKREANALRRALRQLGAGSP